MNPIRNFANRFHALFRKQKLDGDMEDETRLHIELQTQENIEAGMEPEQARCAAMRQFGWSESIKETCREQRGVVWVETLWQDLRYASRMLLKTPGFSAIAILILALGIGVNLALFSLLNEQLLRPREVRQPDELWAILPSDSSGEPKFFNTSRFYYDAIRKDRRAFIDVIGCSNLGVKFRTSEGWQEMRANLVTGGFLSFLGVRPVLGRGFLPEEDDKPGTHSVAVISYRFWQDHFKGDTNVLGSTVNLDNQIVEIVGVAPRGFKGISLYQPDFWIPTSMEQFFGTYPIFYLVGRLRDGVSPKQAADMLAPVVQDTTKNLLAAGDPIYTNSISHFTRVALLREGYGSLPAEWAWEGRKDMTKAATLVGVATALVLLIAAVNLANQFLARALRRRKEMATRLALGATRWTLVRQFMIEGVLLASLGATAAMLVLTWLGNTAIEMMPGVVYARADLNLHLDVRVVGVALVSAILVGAGFTLLPALHVSGLDPFTALKNPDGGSGSRRQYRSLRTLLMVTQVAASLVLLSGTGLCLRAITQQLRIDVGFPAQSLAVVGVDLERVGITGEAAKAIVEQLRLRFSQLPGVESVGMIDMLPLMGERGHLVTDRLEGVIIPEGSSVEFGYRAPGPDCFRALGIPLIEGRDISESDWSAHRPVALVNEAFPRTFWRNQLVLGKRIERLHKNYEIIGITRDARFNTLAQAPEPTVFFAADDTHMQHPNFIIRARQDPRSLLQPILAELTNLHPGLRKSHVSTLQQFMRNQLRPQREAMNLLGRLGALALGLTVLGVYGMMSYIVRQRTRELGIRMAIGAQRADIAKLILHFGACLSLAGMILGLPLAFCGSFLLRHAVFGISPFELQPFLLAAGAVLLAILLACALPAARATRVNPLQALRYE